jgi:HTH-type transcriptional regulator, sugar sensing transcriptional regulator
MMTDYDKLKQLGFSQYEITCYLTLAANHPLNGSQLSRISGVARSRVYDVLRNLIRKGFVLAVDENQYVPLPPEELYKRLTLQFNQGLRALKDQLTDTSLAAAYEYIWTIRGYEQVIAKAKEMIAKARQEIYVRLFPQASHRLVPALESAQARGVGIRYIAMGPMPPLFEIQVTHPNGPYLSERIGGHSFDVIVDKSEALVGIFEKEREDHAPITWTRNRWFVIANRDSLRHDVYHCLLDQLLERGETLTPQEKKIYTLINKES